MQTVRTFQEAASWPGPSLIIAYSHCIAHGIDMTTGFSHQRDAVKSGYLTLYHYDPRLGMGGADQPLKLDSRKPTIPLEQFTMKEGRYAMLAQALAPLGVALAIVGLFGLGVAHRLRILIPVPSCNARAAKRRCWGRRPRVSNNLA